jgi:hypothetical protein
MPHLKQRVEPDHLAFETCANGQSPQEFYALIVPIRRRNERGLATLHGWSLQDEDTLRLLKPLFAAYGPAVLGAYKDAQVGAIHCGPGVQVDRGPAYLHRSMQQGVE